MVKSKLAFFQMRIRVFMRAANSLNRVFAKAKKTSIPLMGMLARKFIVAVLNKKILLAAKVYKAPVARPAVRVNTALTLNMASNDTLPCKMALELSGTISV